MNEKLSGLTVVKFYNQFSRDHTCLLGAHYVCEGSALMTVGTRTLLAIATRLGILTARLVER